MANTVDLTVPDLGDFHDVPVIEVLVKPGDAVEKDAPLATLESDKATMEVPASQAGVIREIAIKVGDKVSTGTVVARVEAAAPASAADGKAQQAQAVPQRQQAAQPDHDAQQQPASKSKSAAQPQQGATIELRVPDIGEFHDVPVIDVLVKPGDRVSREATLVTLESEKASMDVPAESGGTIADVRVKVGDKVSKGTVIATVTTDATGASPAPKAAPPALAAAVSGAPPSRNGGTAPAPPPSSAPVHASPGVRRFARELGVDLQRVSGTGPNARVQRSDIQQFVKRSLAGGSPAAAPGAGLGFALPPWPKIDFAQFGPIERVPRSRIKKLSGANLQRNWITIPHVTQHDDADVTELEVFRVALNAEQREAKVTMLAFLMKAAVAALKRYPDFNASLDGDDLVHKGYYNIGFAADTPGGLVVPVVREVDRKGVLALAKETADLAAKAREGRLGMGDMQGGTFTISSLGGIGGTYFTPIVNAPEVAILGVCRAATRPIWDGKAFVPRLMLPLSLSYDHRVVDGAAAARFTLFLARALEDMRRTLL